MWSQYFFYCWLVDFFHVEKNVLYLSHYYLGFLLDTPKQIIFNIENLRNNALKNGQLFSDL